MYVGKTVDKNEILPYLLSNLFTHLYISCLIFRRNLIHNKKKKPTNFVTGTVCVIQRTLTCFTVIHTLSSQNTLILLELHIDSSYF